jgi:hypothetical protein
MNVSGVSVKEVVEMIESRIPGGRYVTSILIGLLVLTLATATGIYLYHTLVLPVVLGVSSLLKTGQVAPTTVGGMIGALIGSVILSATFRYMTRSTLNMQKTLLISYEKFDNNLGMLVQRLETIENRVVPRQKVVHLRVQ